MELYVFDDDETVGPFEPAEVRRCIASGEMQADQFGFCEGMPDWRVLTEALVWAEAEIIVPVLQEFIHQVELQTQGIASLSGSKLFVTEALRKSGTWPTSHESELIGELLKVNVLLHQNWEIMSQLELKIDQIGFWELTPVGRLRYARDWAAAWEAAGGAIYQDRAMASVVDPVWRNLSDFGVPFPPFSMDSGMGVHDVDRQEAAACGLDESDFDGNFPELPNVIPVVPLFKISVQ